MNAGNQPPIGQRFSLTYQPRSQELSDSPRFRNRVIAFLTSNEKYTSPLIKLIPQELGIDLTYGAWGIDWKTTLKQISIADFLDTITLCSKNIQSYDLPSLLSFIRRTLKEEGIALRVDDRGGFHPLVDQAFEAERIELIQGLNNKGFKAAAEALSSAHDYLSAGHEDTLSAARSAIDAVENVFKVITAEKRIGATEIKSSIPNILPEYYDERARNAALRLIASFSEWTNAAHQYRHADGQPEPTPPPRDITIQFMSAGAGWIRWLISFNGGPTER
jgi:hypothetical protein